MESNPQYVLGVSKKRIVVPRVILDIFLCIVLVALLMINLSFLRIDITPLVIILTTAIVIVILAIDVVLNYTKASVLKYYFYTDRIIEKARKEKTIMLADVKETKIANNVFDKLFNTSSIVLEPKFNIVGAENADQLVP